MMRLSFLRKRSALSGFTLIELLVVIAIIGVLASIVLASLSGARAKSRDARRIADTKQIQLALELYYDATSQTYPTATATCDIAGGAFFGLQALVTGGFIPSVPRDPQGTACYKYVTNATPTPANTVYHLSATLEQTNPALDSDKDCVSSGAPTCPGMTTVNGTGFDGADSGKVYDVVP